MRALRALVAGLLGVLIVLGPTLSAPTAAQAADPQSWVSITFTAMNPALPERDGTVQLAGTVTNTSNQPLTNLQAVFWRSLDPISDSEGMAAALNADADVPLGSRVKPNTIFQNIPSESDRTLAPKESTPFSLTVKVSELELPPIDATYLLGIHIRGRVEPNGPDITLGRGRVFAPIVANAPANASQLSTLVVLESRPSLVRAGVFADDHLAGEIGPNGRLTALLAAAGTDQTSFAIDPALIEELQTMRAGYTVLGSDGTTTAGTGQSAATRWLSDYTRMASRQTGYRLLYGHPDVAALVHAGLTSVLEDGETAARTVTSTSALPLLAMPVGGQADQQTVEALAALKPTAIVVDDSSSGESRPLLQGPDGIPLLNTAATSFGGGPGPDPRNTAVQIRQHALAETWLEAVTAGPDDTIGQLRVIRTQAQATSGGSELEASWLRREPLDRLLDSTPATWSSTYRYSSDAAGRELSTTQVAGIRALISGYQTYTDLLVRPGDVQEQADAAIAKASSASWRGETTTWDAFVDPQQATLDDIRTNAVKVSTTPKVVTSAHSVQFPVTVRNTLQADPNDPLHNAVKVRVVFDSANGQRLTVTPSADLQDLTIAASSGETRNAQVDARANGTVRVTARVYTVDGTQLGTAFPIDVQATQAGTVGWLIAIAAGLVLIGGSALRIRQVARERSAAGSTEHAAGGQPATGTEEPPPTSSAQPVDVPPTSSARPGDTAPRDPESLDV